MTASKTKIGVLQMCSGIDPNANARTIVAAAADAAKGGAAMLFTPEMCGMLDRDRRRASGNIVAESDNVVLAAAREAAQANSIWIALGSLAVLGEGDKWANRSFVINPNGEITARYNKIHMFDVDLASGETWRESSAFDAGTEVVTAATPAGELGLAVCYDMRFPALFEALGAHKCDVIALPAAFTVPTGLAHWHLMLRARAVEASAYVVAAAQVGEHEDGRKTYGHSLVVDPWGEVVLDLGSAGPSLGFAEIDAERIAVVRQQLPSLANRRMISTGNGA